MRVSQCEGPFWEVTDPLHPECWGHWQLAEWAYHLLGTAFRPEGPKPRQSGCWRGLIHEIPLMSLSTSEQRQKTFYKVGRKVPPTPLWFRGRT